MLYLSSSPEERSLCLTVLEIFYLIFRQSSPEDLVRSCQNKSNKQMRIADSDVLADLVEREMSKKKQEMRTLGTRHSRFGGTFEVHVLFINVCRREIGREESGSGLAGLGLAMLL